MKGRPWRLPLVAMVLTLSAAACGDDDGATTAASSTTGVATTTTVPWGEQVAPGAEAMLEGAQVLLQEDFQDGDTAGWRIDSGWYLLNYGERRMLGAGGAAWALYEEGLTWTQYGMRLGFLVDEGSLGVSVAVGAEGRYLVHLTADGVYLLKDAPYGDYAALGSAQPAALGKAHVLVVGVDGGHLQVFVDGVLLIDANDPIPLAGGSIGLGMAGGAAVVDNIVVAALGGPLPQLEPQGEPASAPLPGDLADQALDSGLEPPEPPDPGLPDLRVLQVEFPEGNPVVARAFTVRLTVQNAGGGDAPSFGIEWASFTECETEGALAAGETADFQCEAPGFPQEGGAWWHARVDQSEVVDEGAGEENNEIEGHLTVGGPTGAEPLPDLEVSWTLVRKQPVVVGEPVDVEFAFAQTEAAWQGEIPELHLRMFFEDGETACADVVYTRSGETGGTCDLEPFTAPGVYRLTMLIDANDVLAESDEADNTTEFVLTVLDAAMADWSNLYLHRVSFDPADPAAGEEFEATVWVLSDVGALAPISSYTIRLFIDDVLVCSHDTDMSSGGAICPTAGLAAGPHTWAAYIDADDDVAEYDEDDNSGFGQFTVEG